jgi:hypothetical protein
LPLALALLFAEFAHQYSVVKDLKYSHQSTTLDGVRV